jgi:hypothetical protein
MRISSFLLVFAFIVALCRGQGPGSSLIFHSPAPPARPVHILRLTHSIFKGTWSNDGARNSDLNIWWPRVAASSNRFCSVWQTTASTFSFFHLAQFAHHTIHKSQNVKLLSNQYSVPKFSFCAIAAFPLALPLRQLLFWAARFFFSCVLSAHLGASVGSPASACNHSGGPLGTIRIHNYHLVSNVCASVASGSDFTSPLVSVRLSHVRGEHFLPLYFSVILDGIHYLSHPNFLHAFLFLVGIPAGWNKPLLAATGQSFDAEFFASLPSELLYPPQSNETTTNFVSWYNQYGLVASSAGCFVLSRSTDAVQVRSGFSSAIKPKKGSRVPSSRVSHFSYFAR